MKISFPLSLKISLWLLLNLTLLGAVGVGFLLGHGGLGWNALLGGAAGDHVQAIGDALVGEINGTPDDARNAVVARTNREHGVQFFLFSNYGPQLAGAPIELPIAVRGQLVPPALGEGPPGCPPGPEGFGPPPDGARRLRPAGGPLGARPPASEPAGIAAGRGRGRFFINDHGYWIGLRVPFQSGEYGERMPATLLIHPTSSWGLLRLLDVQPWLLAGAGVMVFSILFWIPIVRGITRSLGQLNAATGKIAEGEFQTRVPATRRDELGHLGDSVNQMAGRLDTLVNGQKRFLADIAHELGSPIGRLQVAVEILETRASDPALQAQVADVREEVQQMSALVNELLAFTKAGLVPRGAELAPVELAPLVAQAVAREGAEGRVTAAVPAGLTARADGPLLARAVGNLVRNALRYSGDTPITVSAHNGDGRVVVTVADEGPGVPAEALKRLGEPFYRPEAARTREAGGTGLGLAIVRTSIAACGGTVRFANRNPRGFIAELLLASA